HLHESRAVPLGGDLTEARLNAPARHSGIHQSRESRLVELHAVKKIEHFRTELKMVPLAHQADILDERQVPIALPVRPECVPPRTRPAAVATCRFQLDGPF